MAIITGGHALTGVGSGKVSVTTSNSSHSSSAGESIYNLSMRLAAIERVLNIPERDFALEQEYPYLRSIIDNHLSKVAEAAVEHSESRELYLDEVNKLKTWKTLSE